MNSEGYCERIVPLIDGMTRTRPRLSVMQDNAPSHSVFDMMDMVKRWYITPIQWLAYSLYLNPVDSVWNIMKYYIQQNYIDLGYGKQQSEDELGDIVNKAWGYVTSERLIGLIKTSSARCRAMIYADARPTKYSRFLLVIWIDNNKHSWIKYKFKDKSLVKHLTELGLVTKMESELVGNTFSFVQKCP